MIKRIRIGTRSSNLALWQANFVKNKIEKYLPEIKILIKHIKTQGDINQVSSLTKVGGEGIFTKTIEKALIDNKIDIAVHSLKDLPTENPDSLTLSAVPERGPIADIFLGSKETDFNKLSQGATIASGSIRRRAQLLAIKPGLNFVDLRGNIETRLKKLKQNDIDGIIVAEAALKRLNLLNEDYYRFSTDEVLPAVSQGAIGLQTRRDDQSLESLLEKVNDPSTYLCITAERAFLRTLDSGCQFPVAANAKIIKNELLLTGLVLSVDGQTNLKDISSGIDMNARQIGVSLAEKLINRGALELLSED
jgi:hydroxymethylbilane synthase